MGKFVVTGPDGKEYEVEAPEGATEAQIVDYVRRSVPKPKNPDIAESEAGRAKMPALARGIDTAVRGIARAFPFMDDVAAVGDTVIGKGEGENFGQRYWDNLRQQRATNAVDDRDRPALSYGGQVAGAVALPAGAVAKAATLPAKIAAGAAVGGGYGALSGFGAGESLKDRAERAVTGGLIGTAAGAAVAPVMAGGAYLAKPVVNAVRGFTNPEAEASRRVFETISKATREGRGLSPEDLATARAANSPLVLGDTAGEPGRALARSAANTSPEGREALQDVTQERFAGQTARTTQFVQQLVGGKFDPAEFTNWLQARAKRTNKPLYDRANKEAAQATASSADGLWTPELAKLAESPTFAAAMRDSVPRGADRAVAAGGQPSKSPFVVGADGKVSLAGADNAGNRSLPTLEFWDNVKRDLDAKIITLTRDGDKSGAATVKALRAKLLDTLDSVAPSYKTARATAASFFRAEDALEAGQNFVGMSKSADLVGARKALAKMSPTERALFAQGYAAELSAQVSKIGDNQNVTIRSVFNNPLARQKMDAALGPQKAREMQAFLQVEGVMDRLRTAVSGNSTTARQITELTLAGGIGGLGGWASGLGTGEGAAAGTAAIVIRTLAGKVDTRVARRIAELLASDDPNQLRQAYTIIANNAGARAAFDSLDTALAKIVGTAAGGEAKVPQ